MSKYTILDQVAHAAQGAAVVLPMLFMVQTVEERYWVSDPEAVGLCGFDISGIYREKEVLLGCRYYGHWTPAYKVALLSALCGGIALFWRELSQLRRSNGFGRWKSYSWSDRNWENTVALWHLKDRSLDIAFGAVGAGVLGAAWAIL